MSIAKQMMFEADEREEFSNEHRAALEAMDGAVVARSALDLLVEWCYRGDPRCFEGALRALAGAAANEGLRRMAPGVSKHASADGRCGYVDLREREGALVCAVCGGRFGLGLIESTRAQLSESDFAKLEAKRLEG